MVLEKDPRLVSFINQVARTEKLPGLEAYVYDAQMPLDEKRYKGQFDVVLTDPPDTLEAFAIWISRASLALRGANSALYMGLTSVEAAVTKWFRMQQLAIAARFVITDLRRKFTRYANNPKPVNATVSAQTLRLNITGLAGNAPQDEQVLLSTHSDVHRDTTFVAANALLTPDAKISRRTLAPLARQLLAASAPTAREAASAPAKLVVPPEGFLFSLFIFPSFLFSLIFLLCFARLCFVEVFCHRFFQAILKLSHSCNVSLCAPLFAVLAYFAEHGEKLDVSKGGFSQKDIDTVTEVIRNQASATLAKKRRDHFAKLQSGVGGDVLDLERGNLEVIPELRAVQTNVSSDEAAASGADAVWFTSAFIRMVAVDDERPLLISNTRAFFLLSF